MSQTIVEVNKLNKVFKQGKNQNVHVLKDIDAKIERGEFLSIMGPSGSGKTTFLYNISGMDRMTSGNVLLNGEEIADKSEAELAKLRLTRMGFIFQDIYLLRNLNLFDNVIYTGYIAKNRKKEEIDEHANQLMKRMGIDEIKSHDITEASGGQLQRVGICRALINEPEIIFGDEPTGALNSKATEEILNILLDINSEGTTIVLVTHDIRVAARSQRILFMIDGEIRAEKQLGKFNKEAIDSNEQLTKREEQMNQWLKQNGF